MSAESLGIVGPGHGPGGSPMAIAISPILTGRDAFGSMRSKILEAAPGSRLIPVNSEGHADESLDEVEVLLRGWALGGDPLDRLVGRAPRLRWIHSVSVGVESVLTPCVLLRGLTVTNGRGVFDKPIAEYVMTMILAICRRLPQLLELQRERTWQPLEAQEMGSVTVGLVGLGGIGAQVAELLRPFGSRVLAVRRNTCRARPRGRGDSGRPRRAAQAAEPVGLRGPGSAAHHRDRQAHRRRVALAALSRERGSSTSLGAVSSRSGHSCASFGRAGSEARSWTPSTTSH